MSFYDKIQQTQSNVNITENGMVGYKTTYHPLLDMNFKITSYRNKTDYEIVRDLKEVLKSEDSSYVLKFLFMVRDAREGLGERRLFRICIKELINHNFSNKEEIVNTIINNLISEYGRYDDLFVFMGTEYEVNVIKKIRDQLRDDLANMNNNKPTSLLAKWLPSETASNKDSKKMAHAIMNGLGASPRSYRKVLSSLRSYLKVTEVQTSANDWSNIDYNIVPSKANLKYKDAFLKHDEERRRAYLAKLAVGDKTVKINSSVNYPHDVICKYRNGGSWYSTVGAYDETLEQLWKNLPQMKGMENTIVVRDGSGSMYQPVQGNSSVQAIDVANALTLYCAERLNEGFKNKFITFSSRSEVVDLTGKSSVHSRLKTLHNYNDCSNTNLSSVFDLILKTAVDHEMNQEEIPQQILIVSDMEFDCATIHRGEMSNVISKAQRQFTAHGYKLPKLVFWNVCSRTNTIPCRHNDNGVLLVSGFSVNVLKMVMNGETDPYQALLKELNSERYEQIPLLNIVYNNVKKKETKEVIKPSWL